MAVDERSEPSRRSREHRGSADRRRQAREHPKGRFHRPELTTPWQKFTGNIVVRVLAVLIVLGGTTALVLLAISRF